MSKRSTQLLVSKADLANLRESTLTDETIRRNRLRTEGDALRIPYRSIDREVNGFARKRLHKPYVNAKGKEVKYTQPPKSGCRAYFPDECCESLKSGCDPIYITEGEKKALALAQLGLTAIGLGGVWNWKKKGTQLLCDDLRRVKWKGRDVYLVFDFDEKTTTRREVTRAGACFAQALRRLRVNEVHWVELPPGHKGAKQGVDDFLRVSSFAALKRLIKQAKPVPTPDQIPNLDRVEGRTDAANAIRLAARVRGKARWVGTWDKWLRWDGKRWKIDDTRRIDAFAKQVSKDLWKEIAEIGAAGRCEDKTMGAMVRFAAQSNGATAIRNMVGLARSEDDIPIDLEELDSDPWLLNVKNGTIDLRTGDLRPHEQGDFITKLCPVEFKHQANCRRWREFLSTIFDDNDELIAYTQRLIGFSITGVTSEHVLPFLYGIGANGKSTFCELLLKVLGPDYAMKAAPELLMAKRGEAHPTERADLFGKRFVACVETEDGRRLAESFVKELTGGDRIRARRMREDFWEFAPTHHVWLAGNHKPVVTGTDHGIWRRIKLIPFAVVIPDAEQDKDLGNKLAAERAGILNWCIEGCLQWRQNGLQEPDIVKTATKGYADEMDEVGQFLDEECELGDKYHTPATKLYEAFLESQPGTHMTQHAFGASLTRRGFKRERMTSGPDKARAGWLGLRLRKEAAIAETTDRFVAGLKSKKSKRRSR